MPNMEKLLNQILVETTRPNKKLMASKIDLDYAYGKMMLSKEKTRKGVFAITGGMFSGYHRFKKSIYELADIPNISLKNRPSTGIFNTGLVKRHHCYNPMKLRRTHKKPFDVLKNLEYEAIGQVKKNRKFF